MRFRRSRLLLAGAFLTAGLRLPAASNDTQQLNFSVQEVTEFDVIEPALNFVISGFNSNGDGSDSQSAHYSLQTNVAGVAGSPRRVTVGLDQDMPSHTALDLLMAVPVGAGTTATVQNVQAVAKDVYALPGAVNVQGFDFTFTFHAKVEAMTGNFTRVATFSVVP